MPKIHYVLLCLRKPADHFRRSCQAIHDSALVDANRRAFFSVSIFQICLTGQEAFAVNGTGGDEANALTVPIDHRVTVVRHADALVVEAEAYHHALALLLTRHIGVPADEPRLVWLDV